MIQLVPANFNEKTVTTNRNRVRPEIDLVYPYVIGNGENGDSFLLFHESDTLEVGLVLSCWPNYQTMRVMSSWVEEDLFETIQISQCILITRDPTEKLNSIRIVRPMYSTFVEK